MDIGCSGGISSAWRLFGDAFRAFALDPNLHEISRLASVETHRCIEYVPAFVALASSHPFNASLNSAAEASCARVAEVFQRSSVARALELRRAAILHSSNE
jgi:hypothetical protein